MILGEINTHSKGVVLVNLVLKMTFIRLKTILMIADSSTTAFVLGLNAMQVKLRGLLSSRYLER